MLDRESKFSDEEMVKMLKDDFVPVAIDQWYTRRQQDAEGEFYQAIAKQGPRNDMNHTTQGHYVCDASGKLLGYNNNRQVGPIKAIMQKILREFEAKDSIKRLVVGKVDKEQDRSIPAGTVVVQVNSKILGGYQATDDKYQAIFQRAVSRDNLWILPGEMAELSKGNFPDSLSNRIARFHLIDNTRGEPQMWKSREVTSIDLSLDADGKVVGSATIKSANGKRGYDVALRGVIEIEDDSIKKFDLVAKGQCYGNGRYTQNGPQGKFPLAVAFRLVDENDYAYTVAPQGSKGWLDGYLKNQ